MGKQTDVENNNHPDDRREWDPKRLTRFFRKNNQPDNEPNATLSQELSSFLRYIKDDFKNAFSLEHWQTLRNTYNDKNAWAMPQPYQSAIAAQVFAASGVLSVAGTLLKNAPINLISNLSFMGGNVLSLLPLFVRGYQNKNNWMGL